MPASTAARERFMDLLAQRRLRSTSREGSAHFSRHERLGLVSFRPRSFIDSEVNMKNPTDRLTYATELPATIRPSNRTDRRQGCAPLG